MDVKGSAAEPAVITSFKDDGAGGDTNGDGATTAPTPGDWYGILAYSPGAKIKIDYARISYGGAYFGGEVYFLAANQPAKFSLSHSNIINNKGYIMVSQPLSAKISNTNIYNPDFCLSRDPFGMEIEMAYCGGPIVFYSGASPLDAANNYWGHEAGPTLFEQMNSPDDIKGTPISNNIIYQPFLTAAWVPEEPAKPNPVILVPGIMGSWNMSGRWQIDPIFHTYDNLMEALIAAGYKEDSLSEDKPTLFTFPYDWRQDNNITANLLREKIQAVKAMTGSNKVDIVAHSMGGLVTRSYVEGSDYQNDIDQVVFLGTPHQGSLESYLKYEGAEGFFTTGEKIAKYLFQVEAGLNGYLDLTDYIRAKVLTVEQLLPIYSYLKDKQSDSSWQLRAYPLNYPQNNYLENLNSQENISLLKQRVKITNIVSDLGDISTLSSLKVIADPNLTDNKWQSGYPENLDSNLDSLEMGNGDGTVPLMSADSLDGVEIFKTGISDHANLPTIMQKEIIKTLTGKLPENYYNSKITSTFKRWAFFRVYSPVDFAIVTPDGERVGKDFTSNTEINEIPDAFYSGFGGHEEFVLIPNPLDGEYKIETQGVDNGGEYTLVSSLINGDNEISREFSGNITPDQQRDFNIVFSATAENPLGELEPVDAVSPIITINKPAEADKYLRSDNLAIDYTATDDFSGIATTTIMIDGKKVATTTIDLFNYALGQHNLIIKAVDKAGNQAQAQINFEIIANIDSTIADIERIHELGWLQGKIYHVLLKDAFKLLNIEAKFFDREQDLTEKLVRKTQDDRKLTDKQKQRLIEQYNKKLAELRKDRAKAIDKSLDLITKLLGKAKDKNQLNQPGYGIMISDISYLRENL